MKNRAISDKIDAVFRFREEELRKLAPLWGGDTLTQEEYVSISGILSAVHSYFLAKESADPDMDWYSDIDELTGLPKYNGEKKGENKIILFGADALASRKRQIRWLVNKYKTTYGNIKPAVFSIYKKGITAQQMDSTIRNLVMDSVGVNLAAKKPQCTLENVADSLYNYEETLNG